jgi:uncharacterized protein
MPGVEKTMHEFKHGKLRSGSGGKVTSRKQAIAIALSEEREAKKKKKSTDGEMVMSRWGSRNAQSANAIAEYERARDARRKDPEDDDDDDSDEDGDDDEDDQYDSSSVQMRDAFVVDAVRKTKDGYLVANARIARTGIQLYSGHELGVPDMEVVRVYRPPEEVFDRRAMRSMATLPVTLDHPPMMVDSRNWKQFAVGDTGEDVARDGECIRVPLIIKDAAAIDAYEKHGICELSVGYGCELKWGRGETPAGETYDAKQTAIRGNHLAVVPAARGGSRLRIGDDDHGAEDMAKIIIDGQSIELQDLAAKHVSTYIASLQQQLTDANGKLSKKEADEEEEERKERTDEKDAAVLRGEVAALKKQLGDAQAQLTPAAIDAKVKQRTELLLKANAAMDGKADFTGKEPAEIVRTVVMAHMGDAAKDMDDNQMIGAFRVITAAIKPKTGTDRLADSLNLLGQGGGNSQSPKEIKDAAYNDYVKRLTGNWRSPSAA